MSKQLTNLKILPLLQEWSVGLWHEEGYKSAVKKFIGILAKNFGLFQVEYLQIDQKTKEIELRKGAIRIPSLSSLPDRLIRGLQPKFAQLLRDGGLESSEGFFIVTLDNESIFVAMLQEPTGNSAALCWKQPLLGESSPAFRLLGNDPQEIAAALEFLTRQLQVGTKWFRRLDEAQSLLYQDDLTGLFNYRYLDTALESEFRRQSRFLTPFCILFIDLDGFKGVNDIHGHLVGSRVLKETGVLIKEAVRDVDTVIRYGGDEFVVLLIGASTAAGILAAERIRRKVEAKKFMSDTREEIRLTASIGVACCPDHGTDKTSILQNADTTMYESKNTGKNRVSVVKSSDVLKQNGVDLAK